MNETIQHVHDTLNAQPKQGFSLDDIKVNPKAFRFYTGLADYETFKILFHSFGPVVNNRIYHDTKTNPTNIDSEVYGKRGPKRSLTSEQEFFMC